MASWQFEKTGPGYEATVPSNIALLKYWGKKHAQQQWPANDSLSLTLNHLATCTRAWPIEGRDDHIFVLQGKAVGREAGVGQKAFRQLDYLAQAFGFGEKLYVSSDNSFPMGCGIASSASGLGALTLAAVAAWSRAGDWQQLAERGFDREKLAHLARLGSGSACRSFWGGFVKWEAGVSADRQRVSPVFSCEHWPLADTIVIFSEHEKAVSSSEAHGAAWTSPLFLPRLAGLEERATEMLAAIASRDMRRLGPLLEQEALEMHAVMMSASPSTCYMAQASSEFLAWLRQLRKRMDLPLYFTLDAGPNVHILGEKNHHGRLHELLREHFPQQKVLYDEVGGGPNLRLIET